jgi:C1A family cysteine protease
MPKQVPLEQIQARLRTQAATWVAGETSISRLSDLEQQRRLGLQVNLSDLERIRARILAEPVRGAQFASTRDWRDKDGHNWITLIKDQGDCGSCVAFATVASIEAQARIFYNQPTWSLDLSEADLFFCGAGKNCGSGWWPPEAMQYVHDSGVTDESCFPYQDHDMDCQLCGDRTSKIVTIDSYVEVANVDKRKEFLDKSGPMVACMAVYQDFFHYKSGVYHHVTGELAGYHAICCVGYDEAAGCWICKNSWGDGFGEDGYFRIAYGECDIDTHFAMYGPQGIGGTLKPGGDEQAEQGDDWAESVFTEYSFATQKTIVSAMVKGKLRMAEMTNGAGAVEALEEVLFTAPSIRVFYKGDKIERLVGTRKLNT